MSAPQSRPSALGNLFSKLLGVDVDAMNDGHGLGCPCPKHRAEAAERLRVARREGFAPGTLGAALEEGVSAAVGRALLDGNGQKGEER